MERRLSFGLLAITLALAASPAGAQTAQIHCTIPFAFSVKGATLPPGDYTFWSDQSALYVRGVAHGAIVLTRALPAHGSIEPRVIFEKHGEEYVLREAWVGLGPGREVPRTSFERERLADQGDRPTEESRRIAGSPR